jgi:hypothetical protein
MSAVWAGQVLALMMMNQSSLFAIVTQLQVMHLEFASLPQCVMKDSCFYFHLT